MPEKSRAISPSQNDGAPSDQEVRASLEALLSSEAFDATSRNRRFLTYVVEETLAGRGDRIKAYSIAISVFGRADDFNPLTDPIVRIEASRIRRSLKHYYLTAGRNDRIRIDMPKGAYVATFRYQNALDAPTIQPTLALNKTAESENPGAQPALPSAESRNHPLRIRGGLTIVAALITVLLGLYLAHVVYDLYRVAPNGHPSIRVDRMEADSTKPEGLALARGLTYELVNQLASRSQFRVFAPDISPQLSPDSRSAQPDYILSGFARSDGSTAQVTVQLTDSRTGRAIWASSFEAGRTAAHSFDYQVKASEAIVDDMLRHVDPSRRVAH